MDNRIGNVMIQADAPDKWHFSLPWQIEMFKKTRMLGGMGGYLCEDAETSIETHIGFRYKIQVTAGWGKITLINLDTNRKREMIELTPHDGANNYTPQ